LDNLQSKYPEIKSHQLPQCLLLQNLNHHNSTESINSVNSMFSQRSYHSTNTTMTSATTNFSSVDLDSTRNGSQHNCPFSKSKKFNWIRSSFSKAFRKQQQQQLNNKNKTEDCENGLRSVSLSGGEYSLPNSPMHQILNRRNSSAGGGVCPSPHPLQLQSPHLSSHTDKIEEDLQRQLRDKDIKLTDIRLEALATARQLDQSKDEMLKMRSELEQLRNENSRLHQQITHSSILSPAHSSSSSKMNTSLSINNVNNILTSSCSNDSHHTSSVLSCMVKSPTFLNENNNNNKLSDGKRVPIAIYLGDSDCPLNDFDDETKMLQQIYTGSINVCTKTKWDILDNLIKRHLKEYLNRLDQTCVESGGLGLSADDSIQYYYVGDMLRKETNEFSKPDLLPYGYLVGNHTSIIIKLKENNGLESLSYDTLVPKNVLQRYISLLSEHRNLLFCGPCGTNKSYVARKIGEYFAKKDNISQKIEYFNAENKSSRDLKEFLANVSSISTHSVLFIDNLQHIPNISDAFMDYFESIDNENSTYIIGTINQSNVASLNLHQNFKWVLFVNHTEPVKNFLNRYLEREIINFETKSILSNQFQVSQQFINELKMVFDWLPKLWQHVNKYIECYNSVDLIIGPKLLCSCPLDFKQAMHWFINLWNANLIPNMIEVISEGIEVYDTKISSWEDPKLWVFNTSPWSSNDAFKSELKSIELHHLGQEVKKQEEIENQVRRHSSLSSKCLSNSCTSSKISGTTISMTRNSNDSDKLLNMLLKLQETTMRGSLCKTEEEQLKATGEEEEEEYKMHDSDTNSDEFFVDEEHFYENMSFNTKTNSTQPLQSAL
jgi:neuron navigator 2